MYQEGYSAYTKGNWQEAIDKLSKVVELQEDYQNGNAVYYLAQSYRRTEELEKAMGYYQIVVETHPGTERARVAQSFINSNPDLVKPQDAGDEEEEPDNQGDGQTPENPNENR
ncbi:MAG: tetratricopeptide repeat protein, partial [Lachnospiraceae bacterium]|nr:tetratricopeptide repeat protein [Lachnospiraceae bacterium]